MDPAERLRPYVAGLAATWCEGMPEVRHRGVSGTLAFVDISGFTTLTERLAAKGKVGAEEMSDLLNESFATLLKVAYGYGASLVKWGGDAVLLLYEGDDHAAQGCRAALEMQRTMRRIGRLRTSVGVVTLKMSVGISSGMFDFFLVGERHRELLVVGPSATETAVMEQIAEAGEVVVSAATAALLPEGCLGPAKDAGWLLRTPPPADPRSRWWPRVDASYVATCLDPALREHLLAEVGESEHRQVAVGFVEVSGVDELLEQQGPAATAGALHQIMNVVQDACARHRVTFWETDISKDGFKVLLIGGAPKTSGHDEDAMVRASRWILDRYSGPVQLRIGVNSGRVFNGGFGPPFRRTWSVKGDAVNLAARVMGKAESGQLLATESLLRRVGIRLEADLLPPFHVKGKKHPVQAAVVRAVTGERVAGAAEAGAFVGRRAQMDLLMDSVRAAETVGGGGIEVIGQPGIGKSRLVDHACSRVSSGTTVLRGFADNYESATPYYAVRRLLLAAIGLPPSTADERVARELLRKVGARAPGLAPWLPLLATTFDVQLPETAETAAVQEQFRRPRALSLVVELLDAVLTGPTVFVVDDMDDADEASVELLTRLAAEATERRWLVLLVGRELPAAVRGHEAFRELVVLPLDADDARALLLETGGGERLAPHVIRAIVARGEGNPLFLRELAVAATTSGDGELPSTLEEVLAAQIDELAPAARRLLRSVSVLGTRFDESLAVALLEEPPTIEQWSAVDHFLAQHADGSRRFRTGLARDAAYEGLPFRRRVELHSRAATELESRAEVDGDDRAEALSLHCLAAGRYADAWRHSRLAGDRARHLYANGAALTLFGRALIAARRIDTLPKEELAGLHETIADLHARQAALDAAIRSYQEARRTAPRDSVSLRARCAIGIALASARAGFPGRAMRWFSIAARDLDAPTPRDETERAVLRARVTVERALAHYRQGRHKEAAVLSSSALDQAECAGADFVVARALHILEISQVAQGHGPDEKRVLRALDLFEKCGDLTRQAHMRLQLGVSAYYGGAWDVAVDRYERARELYERAGDDWNMAIASANVAEILVDQGRLADAEPLVQEALRVWRLSGTPWDIGFGAALFARLRARQGRYVDAMLLLGEAIDAYNVGQERFDLIDADLRVVEALVLQGAADIALQRLDAVVSALWAAWRVAGATSAAQGREGRELPAEATQTAAVWRLRGYAVGQLGDTAAASDLFQRSLDVARGRSSAHDIALALDAMTWLRPGGPVAAERDELFARLGIVWTPVVPARAIGRGDPLALIPQQRVASANVPAKSDAGQ